MTIQILDLNFSELLWHRNGKSSNAKMHNIEDLQISRHNNFKFNIRGGHGSKKKKKRLFIQKNQ